MQVNLQLFGVIAKPSQYAAFWCYCKTFPIHSFLVLLQNLPNTRLSGVIAKPSQYTAFWCYFHYLLCNTQQFYDLEGWCRDEISAPWGFGGMPARKF
jgi:hypothetical protein